MVEKSWGKFVAVDLNGCDESIRESVMIRNFISGLCDVIGMKMKGSLHLERFGVGELDGYSCIQFIETSSVTAHFDEKDSRAFIDIFSCKDFDEGVAADFCKEFFNASEANVRVLERG
ncbi:MAG: S-adenosylmethionine decarboxylase [Nanoarchaeota archaeon]|nr:S-adenosylmethionine decarboxylase [Nanoarchaeota archaeon]